MATFTAYFAAPLSETVTVHSTATMLAKASPCICDGILTGMGRGDSVCAGEGDGYAQVLRIPKGEQAPKVQGL